MFQVNSVLFITLLCRINRVSKFRESMTRVQHVKAWLRRSLILLPVLGITWSFGLLTFISSTIVFHYLFTIFNSLQGFVIFFNFCVLDSEVGFLVILVTSVEFRPQNRRFFCRNLQGRERARCSNFSREA